MLTLFPKNKRQREGIDYECESEEEEEEEEASVRNVTQWMRISIQIFGSAELSRECYGDIGGKV